MVALAALIVEADDTHAVDNVVAEAMRRGPFTHDGGCGYAS